MSPNKYVFFVAIAVMIFVGSMHVASATALTATPNPFTLSNSVIVVGQTSVANAVISGGSTGPYSGEWSWVSSSANQVNNQLTNTITVGTGPKGVAFNPSGTLAYVTNYNTNSGSTVSVIDVSTNSVINTITVGTGPKGVAFNPSGTLAYVTNYGSGTVNVIDVSTNSVANTITVGSDPYGVAFNPSGTIAYVTNYGPSPGTVSVIDVSTNSVANTITVGYAPEGVAFNPSGTLAYVADEHSDTVNVIDVSTNSVANTITVGSDPYGVAFNPSGTLAYVTNYGSGSGSTVSVIDVSTNSVINTITAGTNPEGVAGVAFNPSGTLAYVTDSNVGTVSVIGNLPETSVQAIPTNGLLQLTIDAVSSNTLTLTFNGVVYTESTGTNTIYGAWNLYGFAQDNGTDIYYYGSNSIMMANTLTINPPLSVSIASNPTLPATLDANQIVTFNAIPSGGSGSYTSYNFGIYNNAGSLVANMLTTNNIFAYIVPAGEAGNTLYANVIVIDSSSNTANSPNSGNITVNPALATASVPTAVAKVDAGQTAANVILPSTIGGTPSVTYTWLVSYNSGSYTSATTSQCTTLSGTATNSLAVSCITPANVLAGTYAYEVQLKDSASVPENTISSNSVTVTVNPALVATAISSPSSAVSIDGGQPYTITVVPPTTGTSPYTYSWAVASGKTCPGFSSTGNVNTFTYTSTNPSSAESCAFTVTVTDSATTHESYSVTTHLITVNPALATASVPTAVAKVDAGQIAANVILPSVIGGTPPVTYTWLVSYNSGNYLTATTSQCTTTSGTAVAGNVVSCITPANALAGTYTYEMQLTDSANVPENTISSNSVTATITSALAVLQITSPTASYTFINTNHKFAVSAAAATGGTPPYTYAWSANTVACPGFTDPGNVLSFTYTPSSGTNGCIFTLKVSDSASTSVTQSAASNPIVAAPSGAHMFAIANTTYGNVINDTTEGLRFLLPANSIGSDTPFAVINDSPSTIAGPANFNKLYSANVVSSPATVNSINVIADYPCSISSSDIYPYELVGGVWTAITLFSVNASSCTVAFSISADPIIGLMQYVPPASNNNGGGAGVSSNGAGTPEGSSGPTVVPFKTGNETGYNIYNLSADNSEHLLVDGAAYLLTQNFITPNTTGITIDNVSYLLKVGDTLALLGKANVFIHLVALSYIPVLHTVNYTLFAVPGNSTPVNTTSTTTTTVATTTTIKAAPPANSTVTTTAIPVTVPPAPPNGSRAIYYAVVAAIIVAVIIVGVKLASRSGGYKKGAHQGRSK